MTCPKCQGDMRSYERSGVVVDQCNDCRGLFLDRGELERLVDAEGAFYGSTPSPDERRDRDDDGTPRGHQPHKKRKRNFLEELFD